jgi:predicted transposase YbfD/YdcC
MQAAALGQGSRLHRRRQWTRTPGSAHHQGGHPPTWVDFPGATQVAQLRRTVTQAGRKSVEVVYVITFADHHGAPPATLATWVQGHWSIENQLHWVRDVVFDEDLSQVRTGNAPQVVATIRNTAISLRRITGWTNIASALRHHARDPERAVNLLLTC